ncbi:zinc-binding dehydrogenase [Nocardioides jensenii]|uniref:zinc-binding dehydrogenase n=1 Tax=Nocardioides jensenii TaxID=1843 RepID=UPI001470612A|nr:zinc-binding dehydrogenase [Nocardioides jensenii]
MPDHGVVSPVEIPRPAPGPGQVLVEVRAAGMNRADLLHAKGRYGQRAFAGTTGPDVAGMELAGRVVAVGDGVDDQILGTRVMAMTARAYAEYAVVDERLLMAVPEELSWTDAAALPMALLTEYEAQVALARSVAGERVLVIGATSGVGLIGVQLARTIGPASLVATSRNTDVDALLQSLGAGTVAHTPDEVANASTEGYDVVIDHVGGDWLGTALAHLRNGARVVSVGRLGERTVQVDLTALAGKRASLIGTTWKTQELAQIADSVAGVREHVLPAVADGRIRPVVSGTLEFGDIAGGYQRLADGHSPGKLVVVVSRD